MAFGGFPRRVQFTPVPSPLFGPLLEQIDDLGELKCTLRLVWLLHQKKGYPKFVTLSELLADRTLAKSLVGLEEKPDVRHSVRLAVARGTFVEGTVAQDGETVYMLNTERDRAAMAAISEGRLGPEARSDIELWDANIERPNIFAIYEDNIGSLSPMIADELRDAEQLYPAAWIEEAFREAVEQNKRSWRYVERILERWAQEGRGDGKPGRYLKKAGRY
ncbi:MAG: DnaD domain protein [Chloroflexi bacterium]|nr:DnaD domain protein [Chloroflexota bacterium]